LGTITITYETKTGVGKEVIETSWMMGVHLDEKEITSVDLSPLASCEDIFLSVWLGRNNLDHIDLAPLARCEGLDTLDLSYNNIQELDLEPLLNSPNLGRLYLHGNNIAEVQLAEWNQLEVLYLQENKLTEIDLSPLANAKNLREIHLRYNSIETIDLTSLDACRNIETLSLEGNILRVVKIPHNLANLKWLFLQKNELQRIDLSPLEGCDSLGQLRLNENKLTEVDLTPLSECTGLKRILLWKNNFEIIDLEPLAACVNLKNLNLAANNISEIDLSPLAYCSNLERIDLSGNKFEWLDLTPLAHCREVSRIGLWGFDKDVALSLLSKSTIDHQLSIRGNLFMRNYDTPVPLRNLHILKKLAPIIEHHEPDSWKHIHMAHCLTEIIGVGELGFLDITVSDLVSILNESDVSVIQERIIELYRRQIYTEGTTIGFETSSVQPNQPQLRELVPRILELRNSEIESITLCLDRAKDIVDLKPLWLTAHGNEVLSDLGLGTSCAIDKFGEIRIALEQRGPSINAVEDASPVYPQTHISDSMRKYVWAIVNPLKVSLEELHGVGPKTAKILKDVGYESVWIIAEGSEEEMARSVSGISRKGAKKVVSSARKVTQRLKDFRSRI
jgi:hypothetical protein